jgi:toxin FitB
MYLLDTNVLSELMRPAPDARVVGWLDRVAQDAVWTSSVTQAEILEGLAIMPVGRKRDLALAQSAALFGTLFKDRVAAFDGESAVGYARLRAAHRAAGRPISALDAQIAAICLAKGAILATRNTRDFAASGLVATINPWDD